MVLHFDYLIIKFMNKITADKLKKNYEVLFSDDHIFMKYTIKIQYVNTYPPNKINNTVILNTYIYDYYTQSKILIQFKLVIFNLMIQNIEVNTSCLLTYFKTNIRQVYKV